MIDIRVRMRQPPAPLVWVSAEILDHILVNFFLQIDAHGAVGANNFVGAHSGIGRDISSRIGNTGGTQKRSARGDSCASIAAATRCRVKSVRKAVLPG